ncbi:hypothetical protein A9Q99_15005 [Gammaproteobacteria bacterium 45_16_T64]|nr:hypothetical protein A9Q99_15005 [Gammaproteobacteria bacterium 45_16_T64]
MNPKHGIPLIALAAAMSSVAEAAVTANDDTASTSENTPVTIDVLANDTSDIEGRGLFLTNAVVTQPEHGRVDLDEELDIHIYTPDEGYTGTDTFTYEAGDDSGYGDTGLVTITIGASSRGIEGENEAVVAEAVTDICAESIGNAELAEGICGDFSGEALEDVIDQITPDETLALRRLSSLALRGNATQVFKHQRNLRSAGNQSGLKVDGNALTYKNSYGGSAGDDLPSRVSVFASIYTEQGDKDKTTKETGYEYGSNGLALGADYQFSRQLVLGAALGFIQHDLDYDDDGGDLTSDIATLTGYMSYFFGDFSADVQLSYGTSDYDITRNLSSFSTELDGDTNGVHYGLNTRIDWTWSKDSWTVNPYLRFDYVNTQIDDYQESGGTGLALSVGDQEQTMITSNLGVNVQYAKSYDWGVLIPKLTVLAVNESSTDYDPVSFSFINDNANTEFELIPDSEDSLYYEYELGLVAAFNGGWSGFVNYQQALGLDDMEVYQVSIGARSEF